MQCQIPFPISEIAISKEGIRLSTDRTRERKAIYLYLWPKTSQSDWQTTII